ncbi:MAG: polysaccharide pyruvyl transferase family protein [Clostridia bacterium]|nr:polysaccharide pyruvyl transferase family protein [Clostridia bacterium]
MKISVITCHRAYNYGAVLQAYALQKYLTENGHKAEVIDYYPSYVKSEGSIVKRIAKKLLFFPNRIRCKKSFGTFLRHRLKLSEKTYSSFEELKSFPGNSDMYITGSDQVWNMNMQNGKDDSYFLSFVPEKAKKVSYAASIAMDELNSEQADRMKTMLKDFDAVSVREKSGCALLEELHIPCSQVCDPVYLPGADEWKKFARKVTDEKYILVYAFYGQKNVYEYARELGKKENCKVYSVNTSFVDAFRGIDKYFWAVSPEEFVGLVSGANMVVTNSFHGFSFSLIFNKPVCLFKTDKKGNSRLLDMAEKIGANTEKENSQLIADISDYTEINKKLEEYRKNSMEFLKNCGV